MEERRKCNTVRQIELMIEFLEGHRDLALGRVRSKEARALATRLWRQCAENALNGEGPARTGKEWAKVWNDQKFKVRAKLVSINANQRATGGGPSNAPTLSPLEERVANILGRDIGPLCNVRQDQFASNNDDGVVVEQELVEERHSQDVQMASSDIVFNEGDLDSVTTVNVLPQQPASPVPSVTGQAPSLQSSPRRTTERVRLVRGRRRRIAHTTPTAPTTPAPTHSARSALDESRLMILRIEEMRAEAALANAQANSSFAQSFQLIAESINRFSQKYCRPQSPN